MSLPRPSLLRQLAMVSIIGGLVVLGAFYQFRAIPMLFGIDEPIDAPAVVPLADGLFALGVIAHIAASIIVFAHRNPGIKRAMRRSFGDSGQDSSDQQADGADDFDEAEFDEAEFTDSDNVAEAGFAESEEAEPGAPISERLAGGWGRLRAVLTSRRGSITMPVRRDRKPAPLQLTTHEDDPQLDPATELDVDSTGADEGARDE